MGLRRGCARAGIASAVALAVLLCAITAGCARSAAWRTPQARAFQGEVARLMREVCTTERGLRLRAEQVNALCRILEREPPQYSPDFEVYFWEGRGWVVQCAMAPPLPAGGRVARPPNASQRIRVLGLRCVIPEQRKTHRLTVFEDRVEWVEETATALDTADDAVTRVSGLRRRIAAVVEAESEFLGDELIVQSLRRQIELVAGRDDKESPTFRWEARGCMVEADTTSLSGRVTSRGTSQPASEQFSVFSVTLTVFDANRRAARTLRVEKGQRVLIRYGPTLLASRDAF